MAETEDSRQQNSSSYSSTTVDPTLREVLNELRGQREEVQALRAEVRGNSQNVVSEVKRLKSEKDISWKYPGNKIQFDFNGDLQSTVEQLAWSLDHEKFDYSKELCTELSDKLKKRNKLIRIADSSAGGWETVRHYETNPIASDSDDESKIYKAETRALKRKRSSSRGRGVATTRRTDDMFFTTTNSHAGGKPWGSARFQPTTFARGKSFRGSFSNGNSGSMQQFGNIYGGPSGPCFTCGEYFHYRKNCPNIGRPGVPAGNQSSGGK